MAKWLRPRTWWHAGLMWGTAMFFYYAATQAFHGKLTAGLAARDFLVWESGGLLFGIGLTAVLSLISHRNLFRGYAKKGEGR